MKIWNLFEKNIFHVAKIKQFHSYFLVRAEPFLIIMLRKWYSG